MCTGVMYPCMYVPMCIYILMSALVVYCARIDQMQFYPLCWLLVRSLFLFRVVACCPGDGAVQENRLVLF